MVRVKHAGSVKGVSGALLWSKAVNVKASDLGLPSQSAWYDHSYYKVPYIGALDLSKAQSALHKKFWRPSFGKFGGGTSVGSVKDLGDNSLLVELIYHIGD